MGKNGVALRAAKADNVTYTFTRTQLEAHDQLVRKNCQDLLLEQMERIKKEKNKEIDLYLQEEWKKREEIFNGSHESIAYLLGLTLSVPARVLVERFGWQAIPHDNFDDDLPLVKFSQAVVDEINAIQSDEKKDIRKYNDETYEKYGVKYIVED